MRREAYLYGIFILPSSDVTLEYLDLLHRHQIVDDQTLQSRNRRRDKALEIVNDAGGRRGEKTASRRGRRAGATRRRRPNDLAPPARRSFSYDEVRAHRPRRRTPRSAGRAWTSGSASSSRSTAATAKRTNPNWSPKPQEIGLRPRSRSASSRASSSGRKLPPPRRVAVGGGDRSHARDHRRGQQGLALGRLLVDVGQGLAEGPFRIHLRCVGAAHERQGRAVRARQGRREVGRVRAAMS